MRVALVSAVYPFPVDNGKKVVLSGILRYLRERFGPSNVHYIYVGPASEEVEASSGFQLHRVPRPNAGEQVFNLLWYTVLRRAKSIQESMLFSRRAQRQLDDLLAALNPELVIYDTLRIGQLVEGRARLGMRHVLYMDDLFSVRYGRMLEAINKNPALPLDALGGFAPIVPFPLRLVAKNRQIQRLLLRYERSLVARRERDCVCSFSSSLLISTEEVSRLRLDTQFPRIHVINPYLSLEAANRRMYRGDPTFVLLGSLNIPHNRFSFIHFLRSQMVRIRRMIPRAKIIIVGKHAPRELYDLARNFGDAIEIRGYVEDLSTVFQSACAMIVPLLFGSGVKIKTLEALAQGLPVLATTFGVEGIMEKSGGGCLVENDLDRYPELMASLLDVGYNNAMSKAAREFIVARYGREAIFRQYDELFLPDKSVEKEHSVNAE